MLSKLFRTFSLFIIPMLLICAFSITALAYTTLHGDVLMAVNTDLSSATMVDGSFESESAAMYSMASVGRHSNICDVYIDPATGETLAVTQPVLDPLFPVADEQDDVAFYSAMALSDSEYSVGDTKSIKEYGVGFRTMQCLYIGTYCTVWCCPNDDDAVEISAEIAKDIGEHFDSYYLETVSDFGSHFDADGDGKLAIMCYDIGSQYGSSVSTYTAGYFYSGDLRDANGMINGINFGLGTSYATDCIHLDTYPGMGYSDPLSDIEKSYSTLVHEFQHLINFSYQIAGGTYDSYIDSMEVYLNEAFSMAAEHMVCGYESVSNRVDHFNSSSYSKGYSLTYWTSGNLSGYSNSYLFGQYLRTRYGQQTGTDGTTFFKEVLSKRTKENAADTLSIIADLLNTTSQQLVTDFWMAVYYNEDYGIYGFGGEDWADNISPYIYPDTSYSTSNIYNGGVKYYKLGSEGFAPTAVSSQISLIPLVRYPITITAPENGSISVKSGETSVSDGDSFREGTVLTVSALPDEGYVLHHIEVDGKVIEGSELTVSGSHTVSAVFVEERSIIDHGDVDGKTEIIVYTDVPGFATVAKYSGNKLAVIEIHPVHKGRNPIIINTSAANVTIKVMLLDSSMTPLIAATPIQ